MDLSDYNRFIEMIRIRHKILKHTDDKSIFERLEESIYTSFGPVTKRKCAIPRRTYFIALYIEVLVMEYEFNEMYQLITSRISDPSVSPLILSTQAVVTSLRVAEYTRSLIDLVTYLYRVYGVTLPTLSQLRGNPYLFYYIIKAVIHPKCEAILRKNSRLRVEIEGLLKLLKGHFIACVSRTYDNYTCNIFYTMYLLAYGNLKEVN